MNQNSSTASLEEVQDIIREMRNLLSTTLEGKPAPAKGFRF